MEDILVLILVGLLIVNFQIKIGSFEFSLKGLIYKMFEGIFG